MRSSHRIGPVANWKFYPSPGSKIEICSLKAEHEPIPDICRFFYITAIRGQDILQLKVGKFAAKVVSQQNCMKFFTLYATFCTVFCLPIGRYYTWLISFTQLAPVMAVTNIKFALSFLSDISCDLSHQCLLCLYWIGKRGFEFSIQDPITLRTKEPPPFSKNSLNPAKTVWGIIIF